MKIVYFDCFAGASGDMILGALLDAGLELTQLDAELGRLNLSGYSLSAEPAIRRGMTGTKANITLKETPETPHRHLQDILDIIRASALPGPVKRRSITIFERLAAAEAKIHGVPVAAVHFHEVGAMDAIIDIVGAVIGLNLLGIERVYASPLHLGSGTVTCAHGKLPVPAPATAELTRNVPVYSDGVTGELLTPTGAAILTTLAHRFGPLPAMTVDAIGYGAGSANPEIPNLLRVFVGRSETDDCAGYNTDHVTVLECAIDDMNPQLFGYVTEKLLQHGALDACTSPLFMKKNRPGTLLTVLCRPSLQSQMADILFSETTTLGVRVRSESRWIADREIITVSTQWGEARVKIARCGGAVINLSPEYKDCRKIAEKKNIPLKQVLDAVRTVGLSMVDYNSINISKP